MKITITQDFETAEAAAVFLARVGNPAYVAEKLVPTYGQTIDTVVDLAKGEAKAARKPRADAGKTREPYGPRATTTGEPVASEPGTAANSVVAQPAVPATPTTNAATAAPAAQQRGETAPSAPAAATVAEDFFSATLEGARQAMSALNNTKGKGMDACIATLKANGVNRISDLPKEKYAEFIKQAIEQSSAEGIAEAKKPKAKK